MDRVALQVLPLDKSNRELGASSNCFVSVPVGSAYTVACHVCVVTGPAAHLHAGQSLYTALMKHVLEITDSSMPSCCLLP